MARRSTGTAHRLLLFTGCPADSVSHTDSASGSSGFGYYVRQKPEMATTPEQSEGKPSPDSRVAASLWNTSLQTMTVPLQGWHFETAKVNGGRFFPLKILSLGRDRRFGVRSYCVREERHVTLRLWSAAALVSLHIFSPSIPKKWVSLACRGLHTCLILPYGRSCGTARKTASPAGEAQRASNKREKN